MLLANLLPGLRELRAPLAAGYTALLAAFLLAGGEFATEDRATDGPLKAFFDVSNAIGKAGAVAALTFIAYIVGALISDLARAGFNRFGRSISSSGRRTLTDLARSWCVRAQDEAVAGPPPGVAPASGALSAPRTVTERAADDEKQAGWGKSWPVRAFHAERSDTTLGQWFKSWAYVTPQELYPKATLDNTDPQDLEAISRVLANQTYHELDLVLTRLLGEQADLYSAVDRLRAEADLRQAISLSAGALAFALACTGQWLPALAVAAIVVCLPPQAARRLREANDLLVQALWLERVEAPTLERFRLLNNINAPSPLGAPRITPAGRP